MVPQSVVVEGKIVSVTDGEKRMNKGFTYGYRSLRVKAWDGFYSVLVDASKFNKFGFIPKEGQWIKVEGKLFQPKGDYDPSIKFVKSLVHIEPPEAELILEKLKRR